VRIDVCILTLTEPKNRLNIMKNVPINNLIIEKSKPLAMARMRAIHEVKTEWFAFVDDDVLLTKTWFKTISSLIEENVGAIEGDLYEKGLGKKWDKTINGYLRTRVLKERRLGDRGLTINTLIRTSLLLDWKPSRDDLSAWEDFEICQHILRKGYKWLVVPVEAYHLKSWKKAWSSEVWSMQNWKKINPLRAWLREIGLRSVYAFELMFDWFRLHLPWRVRFYWFYQTVGTIWGLLRA